MPNMVVVETELEKFRGGGIILLSKPVFLNPASANYTSWKIDGPNSNKKYRVGKVDNVIRCSVGGCGAILVMILDKQ